MQKPNLAYVLIFLGTVLSASQAAACEFNITQMKVSGAVQSEFYDVFSSSPSVSYVTIVIARKKEQKSKRLKDLEKTRHSKIDDPAQAMNTDAYCAPVLNIKNNGKLVGTRGSISYVLDAGDYHFETSANVISITDSIFDLGEKREYLLRAVIPPNQTVPSGTYIGEILASVQSKRKNRDLKIASSLGVDPTDSNRLNIQIDVGSAARVLLAGSSGKNQNVDFGTLTYGKTAVQHLGLIVQSTSAYRVRAHSLNAGKLLLNGLEHEGEIFYTAKLAGEEYNLKNNIALGKPRPYTNKLGDFLQLELTVPSMDNIPAGRYSDTLTISVMPDISAL